MEETENNIKTNIEETNQIQEQKTNGLHEILKFFAKKGFLLDNDLLKFFDRLQDNRLAEDILNKVSFLSKTRVITKSMVDLNFREIEPLFLYATKERKDALNNYFNKPPEILKNKEDLIQESPKKIEEPNVPRFRILSSNIIKDKKIEVRDFVRHFKNRYNFLKDILKTRKELDNLVSIDKLRNDRNVSIIGAVYNKRVTKNKNILLELEDPTGRVTALINQNKPEIFEKAKEVILDDIIGLKCSGTNEILFVNDLFFADSVIESKAKIEKEEYAVFISDMHIGSANFLEDNFNKFIDWLNGIGVSEDQKDKISKIRYMIIVGDTVDGVGIYPGQDKDLKIKDMKEQYVKLASFLRRVPKNITMIMCPGQHDAVRVPEPQPPVDKDFAEPLLAIENLYLVSNPSTIEIGSSIKGNGIKILMYHGASLHGWMNDIEELRMINAHHCPAKAVKYLLKHRHLSPTHSSTTYVPDETGDSMVIREVPDIITTGEVHRTDIDMYNNILIICNSCWQSMTAFEEKVGNKPDPCKVPMLNLKTRGIKILDFT